MAETDEALLGRWRDQRDSDAFREIVRRYSSLIHGTARRILGDAGYAEDVTQECFFKLLSCSLGSSRALRLGAWLHRVATNLSLDVLRREQREARTRSERPHPGPAREARWTDVEPWIDRAIAELPERTRSLVIAHYLQGRTHRSIGEELGIPRETVTYRIARGTDAIRSSLRRNGFRVGSALLAGWLTSVSATATPASLTETLGKMALSGSAGPTTFPGKAATGTVLGGNMNTLIATAASILLVLALLTAYYTLRDAETDPLGPVGTSSLTTPPTAPSALVVAAEPKSLVPAVEPVPEAAPPRAPLAQESASCSVSGVVQDRQENPIPFAAVSLLVYAGDPEKVHERSLGEDRYERSRWLVTESDESGRFEFTGIDLFGLAWLTPSKDGLWGRAHEVMLESGDAIQDFMLELQPAKMLVGRVVALDGEPVRDAVVSVHDLWKKDMAFGRPGPVVTQEDGSFVIGVDARATLCTFRVNSDVYGQDFFSEVPVRDEAATVVLKLPRRASIRGHIRWRNGAPADDLVVSLTAAVPEPPETPRTTARIPKLEFAAPVSGDGSYVFEELSVGFHYDITVVDNREDRAEARMHPLSPEDSLELTAGEERIWDQVITMPTIVHGRVLTETDGEPVRGAEVYTERDGKILWELHTSSAHDGSFRFEINTGAGEYVLYAETGASNRETRKITLERWARTIRLDEGASIPLELRTFDPVVIPFRLLEADGSPVTEIPYAHAEGYFKTPSGEKTQHGRLLELDDEGRAKLTVYSPVREVRLEVAMVHDGPPAKSPTMRVRPGQVLGEVTLHLPPSCLLTGVLVDQVGLPFKDASVEIEATYENGDRDRFSVSTDREGVFSSRYRIRAEPFKLTLWRGGHPEKRYQTEADGSGGEVALELVRIDE